MSKVTHLEQVGNQFKLYYDDTTTAVAVPTQGSIWLVGLSSDGSGPGPVDEDWAWPYAASRISSPFGPRSGRWHEGTDFAGGPASHGRPIPSVSAGVIELCEYYGAFGNTTIVNHGVMSGGSLDGMTIKTLSAHQVDEGYISVGTSVTLGQTVGLVNNSGSSFGSHLHLEIHAIPPGGSMIFDNLDPNPAPPASRTSIDFELFMAEYNPTNAVIYA